jgi:hypothetical protein
MFPRAIQGAGGKSERCTPYHLVNAALGITVADPVAAAPSQVNLYRGLVVAEQHVTVTQTSGQKGARISETSTGSIKHGTLEPLLRLYGPTLGARLDGLVTALQLPENQRLRALFRDSEFSIRLTLGSMPQAIISVRFIDDGNERLERSTYLPPQGILPVRDNYRLPAAPIREVVIPFALIDTLTDLWSDSLLHYARRIPEAVNKPATPMAHPQSDTAATLSQAAAAPNQDQARPRASTSRKIRERDKKLKRPSIGPGDDHRHWSDHHHESRFLYSDTANR